MYFFQTHLTALPIQDLKQWKQVEKEASSFYNEERLSKKMMLFHSSNSP